MRAGQPLSSGDDPLRLSCLGRKMMSFGVVIVNLICLWVVAGVFIGSLMHIVVDSDDPFWAIVLMLSVIAAQIVRIANKT